MYFEVEPTYLTREVYHHTVAGVHLECPDQDHAAEDGEAEEVEDAHPAHPPLLPVREEALAAPGAGVAAGRASLHPLVHPGQLHTDTAASLTLAADILLWFTLTT